METERKSRAGRKTKYIPEIHAAWAKSLAMEGLIDKEIAQKMNIARSTLSLWKKEYPEFSDTLKMGKEPADAKVKMSLFKRANGYTYKQRKVIVEMDKEGNTKPSRIETTDITVVPDMGAMAFWLKNRLPKEWADTKKVDMTHSHFEDLMMMAIDDIEEKEE